MKISVFALLTAVSCALVTSCYPPAPPTPSSAPVTSAPNEQQVINDEGQRQLEAARQNMGLESQFPDYQQPAPNQPTVNRGGTVTYPYATKVPNRPGFVFNPYTQNQVDVRGIPSGTLVLDPNDNNTANKFRVP
ncbi:hypothetical protein [Rubritalea marina]|uniref:hypothetical protein n=1 Tax=Rubritalea marina TaxID=361055 RepID=UPI0012EA6610|nr:hypothetical protein [Rubritalea marina]